MGDHSIMVDVAMNQYRHTVIKPTTVNIEKEIGVSIFLLPENSSGAIKQFKSKNPNDILSQIRVFFLERSVQLSNKEPLKDILI